MKNRIRICTGVWALFGVLLAFPIQASAQKRTLREKIVRLDSTLSARYYKIPYDTNYVVRPEGKWTLKVKLNQTGNTFHAKASSMPL